MRSQLIRRDGLRHDFVGGNGALGEHIAVNGVHLRRDQLAYVVDGVDNALITAPDDEPLYGQLPGGDLVGGQLDNFGICDGAICDLRRAHCALLDERGGDRAQRNLGCVNGGVGNLHVGDRSLRDFRRGDGKVVDLGCAHSQVGNLGAGHSGIRNLSGLDSTVPDVGSVNRSPSDMRILDGGAGYLRAVNGTVLDVRVADGTVCNLRVGNRPVMDVGLLDFTCADVRSGDDAFFNLRGADSSVADLCPGDACVLDLGRTDGGFRNLRPDNLGFADLGGGNSGVLNVCFTDGGLLDVGRANRRCPDLQGTHRAVLQVPCADRPHGQLDAADGTRRQLTGRDHAALHAVQRRAEGAGGVLPQQAVVGVLRHAQSYGQAQFGHNHAHGIPQIGTVQDAEVAVFLRVIHVQEVHVQRDRGQVAAVVQLGLCGFAQLAINIALAGFIVLFRIRHSKVSPFHMGISANIRAVDVLLGEIQHVAVLVLACGHNARDHAGFVHIVGDAQQVLALPDLHVRVPAHAVDEVHVVPVPGQLGMIPADNALIAQHGFHRVDVLEADFICRAGEVGVHGEVVR